MSFDILTERGYEFVTVEEVLFEWGYKYNLKIVNLFTQCNKIIIELMNHIRYN